MAIKLSDVREVTAIIDREINRNPDFPDYINILKEIREFEISKLECLRASFIKKYTNFNNGLVKINA